MPVKKFNYFQIHRVQLECHVKGYGLAEHVELQERRDQQPTADALPGTFSAIGDGIQLPKKRRGDKIAVHFTTLQTKRF
jgi:hypothetical protein